LAVLADRNRANPRKNCGFCFDFGHENCFTKTIDWMHVYENQVIATHIHDNFSRGERNADKVDLHLLPFDGNCDYERIMRRMNEYEIAVPLMLEVSNRMRPEYLEWSHREFLATAYERLKRISEMGE
jgi:sugar phosphate isomerase/epimerase